ncbi:hypothetical protein AMECASPLE_032289 [Ameca splendens]|uniref:Uncharacterized protein n=1 Tax=Ameca splendens TaxID=208324 RepID=A0ABV1A516_9TELE
MPTLLFSDEYKKKGVEEVKYMRGDENRVNARNQENLEKSDVEYRGKLQKEAASTNIKSNIHTSESQQEFFRMLDEKIEKEYESEAEKSWRVLVFPLCSFLFSYTFSIGFKSGILGLRLKKVIFFFFFFFLVKDFLSSWPCVVHLEHPSDDRFLIICPSEFQLDCPGIFKEFMMQSTLIGFPWPFEEEQAHSITDPPPYLTVDIVFFHIHFLHLSSDPPGMFVCC